MLRLTRESYFILPNKPELRKYYSAKRHAVPHAFRQQAAIKAAGHLVQQASFTDSQHIACYFAYEDEFISQPIIEAIWHANKTCYLPVLTDSRILMFVQYNEGDTLRLNRYSILEPENISKSIAADKLDLVILPLLAFDHHGHRLGTGGGYYDKTFAKENIVASPPLFGLGYALQQTTQVPIDSWDVPLDAVITENEVIYYELNHAVVK
ncbi:MAG TPA: 5-formyltetrahydrofolate cyclo-ligase [Gammaproteobacteria bacterium]|jgi:5-formyltetrahydrofolate cyclo-ligase|nr:5-formyltetrahydrofolate cyclo-ligase [Gammaproteobacteria bacterium]